MTVAQRVIVKLLVRLACLRIFTLWSALGLINFFTVINHYGGQGLPWSVLTAVFLAGLPKLFAIACPLGFVIAVGQWQQYLIRHNWTIANATFGYSIVRDMQNVLLMGLLLAVVSFWGQFNLAPKLQQVANIKLTESSAQLWQAKMHQGGWLLGNNQAVAVWSPGADHNQAIPHVMITLPQDDQANLDVVVASQFKLNRNRAQPGWQGQNIHFYNFDKSLSLNSQGRAKQANGQLDLPQVAHLSSQRSYDLSAWMLALATLIPILGLQTVAAFARWQRRALLYPIWLQIVGVVTVYLGGLLMVRANGTTNYWMVHLIFFLTALALVRRHQGRL